MEAQTELAFERPPEPGTAPALEVLFPSPGPTPMLSLHEAQERLRKQIENGARCPCCRQYAKIYKRKLHSTMARGLMWLCSRSGDRRNWVNYAADGPRWLQSKGGTLATMEHWKLIEPLTNDDDAKRTSGIWRPTELGWKFAHGETTVPKYAYIYDNRALYFSTEYISVEDALGSKFDYKELMASAQPAHGEER